jgi:hypothetical protein
VTVPHFIDRLLLSLRWRLERSDRGMAVLRGLRRLLCSLFPYSPPYTPLPAERTQAFVPVEVRTSSVAGAGRGLFALQPVVAGTVIGEYCGDQIDSVWRWLRTPNLDYAARTTNPHVRICAARHPEVQVRYVNHHIDPLARNVQLHNRDGGKFLVATRDIAAGEELFLDYGDFYWKLKGIRLPGATTPG